VNGCAKKSLKADDTQKLLSEVFVLKPEKRFCRNTSSVDAAPDGNDGGGVIVGAVISRSVNPFVGLHLWHLWIINLTGHLRS
jgi:hypothetical protein